jgi:hypothetical protein
MPDGVGKEGHAEIDDFNAENSGHRRKQKQTEQGLLHETNLKAFQRQQGDKRVHRGKVAINHRTDSLDSLYSLFIKNKNSISKLERFDFEKVQALSLSARATRREAAWIFGKTAFFPKMILNEIG